MKWYTLMIACIPIYIGLIVLFIHIEHRFTVLETDMKWIKNCFINGDFCNDKQEVG